MDVKHIRDEIAKIDSMLASIDEDLANMNEEPEDMHLIENEYIGILGALSNAPLTTPAPFSVLMDTDDAAGLGEGSTMSSGAVVLDAFTFFGLIQAFSEDEPVMRCLCKIFPSVYGVTITQLEDALLLVDRMSSARVRVDFVIALLGRVEMEISNGESPQIIDRKKNSSSLPLIVGKCCEMIHDDTLATNASLIKLFTSLNFAEWPINVRTQIALSLKSNIGLQTELQSFVESLVAVIGADESAVIETKILWQLVEIGVAIGSTSSIGSLVNSVKISKSSSGPSDVHKLIISLGKLADYAEIPTPIWQALVEKLSSQGILPVYEIEGTLSALGSARVVSDSFFVNTNLFKKRISGTNLTKSEFREIVSYLILTGDKSPQSIITKSIMERRDLFVPTRDDDSVEEMDILVSVLLLSVVASLESGTVIPESILLLKKFSSQICAYMKTHAPEKAEIIACLFQVLLPSTQIEFPKPQSLPHIPTMDNVESVLHSLGFSVDGEKLLKNAALDSSAIVSDFAIPSEKLAIVIERWSVYNCTTKRATLCGPTALKVSVLANRKNYKVVVVIPEIYADEKALMQLFSDPIRRVPVSLMNTTMIVDSLEKSILSHGQRIGHVVFGPSLSIVEVSKFLFSILKNSVFVGHFDFSQTNCGISDQFLSLLLVEFFASFMVRHKLSGVILNLRNCPMVTVHGVTRFVESLVAMASPQGGLSGPLRIQSDFDESGISKLTESLTSIELSVASSPAQLPSSNSSIYLG